MPETAKKEPGRPDVVQRERGDPRQHHQPIEKQPDGVAPTEGQDRPPASSNRGDESPWMGGG
jgi:hypothetical protein